MNLPPICKATDPSLELSKQRLSPYEAYAGAYEAQRAIEGQHLSFTPTKAAIYDFFDKKISKTAIREWDDQYCVIGKTCIINLEPNGIIDVWICNPKNMYAGLGQKAVRNRLQAFAGYTTSAVSELDGEAWIKTGDKQLILRNLKLLGIRKQAEYSPIALDAMKTRMKAARVKMARDLLPPEYPYLQPKD